MAAVIGFLAISVIVTATVATSVVGAMGATSMTQASVQSQAAAEAGVAQAQAVLAGTCTASTITGTNPAFSATIYRSTDGTTWTEGCPNSTELAKVVSTGTAQSAGSGGYDRYDQLTVEAIFSANAATSAITPGGPAIYSYSGGSLGAGASISVPPGLNATVMLYEADMNCNGAFTGPVTLVVQGNFTSSGGCSIVGDVWATGNVAITGGSGVRSTVVNGVTVGGNVTGNAVTVGSGVRIDGNIYSNTTIGGQANVGGWISGTSITSLTGSVGGGVWARTGNASISASVNGPITVAGNLTIGNAGQNIAGSLTVAGLLTHTGGTSTGLMSVGSLQTSGGSFRGGSVAGNACFNGGNLTSALVVRTNNGANCQNLWNGFGYRSINAGVAAPILNPSPTSATVSPVPPWVDFGASAFDYTSQVWTGFTVATMPVGACGAAQLQAALVQIGSSKGVIDARNCTGGLSFGGGSQFYEDSPNSTHHGFKVRNDLGNIANTFNIYGSSLFVGQRGT